MDSIQQIPEFVFITLIKVAVVLGIYMTTLAYLQWVERKVIAHVQVRMGPSRVGPHGLLQPLADVIKFNETNRATELIYFGQDRFIEAESKNTVGFSPGVASG